MKLGDVLKKERENKKLSQEDVAKHLNVALDEYQQIEAGETEAENWGPWLAQIAIALETPTSRLLAESGRFDAVIALGVVIRGGTAHFDYVCSQAARGVLDASMATSVPVTFGVLTCDTLDQALERAGSKGGNKGADAAMAALEMAALRSALQGS